MGGTEYNTEYLLGSVEFCGERGCVISCVQNVRLESSSLISGWTGKINKRQRIIDIEAIISCSQCERF